MTASSIDRRHLVRTAAGVAVGGVLVAGSGVAAASADEHAGLIGSWWLEHSDDPPAPPSPGIAIVSMAPGGVIVANDIRPAGVVRNGSWSGDADHFRATLWAPLAPPTGGADPGSTRVQIQGRLSGGVMVGTAAITGYSPDGTQIFSGTGTFRGTRLRA